MKQGEDQQDSPLDEEMFVPSLWPGLVSRGTVRWVPWRCRCRLMLGHQATDPPLSQMQHVWGKQGSQLAFGMPSLHDWALPLLKKSPASCRHWSEWGGLWHEGFENSGGAWAELSVDPCSRRTWVGLMRLGSAEG